MSLYADAVAAYRSAQSGREDDARTALAGVLSPEDVSGLTAVDVQVQAGFTRYVFTDGYLHLAVVLRDAGSAVHLVTGELGDWTDRGAVASLAELGKLLPSVLPPPDAGGSVAAWAPGVAYTVGDQVTYDGSTYECLQAHTSQTGWEPPNVPALWKKTA